MAQDRYERMRTILFGGHTENPFEPLLKDRDGIRGPLQGTPESFSQILYELADGEPRKLNETVVYEVMAQGRRDLLKFRDGSLYQVVKAKHVLTGSLIVVTPYLPTIEDMMSSTEAPLADLILDVLQIGEAFHHVSTEYRREEVRQAREKAATEQRIMQESLFENVVAAIEQTKSGETVMVRGLHNIDALIQSGFVPGLVNNPDLWIDAEDYPGLKYSHVRTGIEMLLTGRERFRPIEEANKLEFYFLVHRSDDAPTTFARMARKFRMTNEDGAVYTPQELREDLVALVKYPEELKGRTEEDLGLVADEVELAIDRRQQLDKGILPYEAVFQKNTPAILDHIRQNRTPTGEVRKALDYFEYTGMISAEYKKALQDAIAASAAPPVPIVKGLHDMLYDQRVKVIVADVLRQIPRERMTVRSITIALTPYVTELGFGRLVKIRDRILQLKDMVHYQHHLQ